MDKNIIKETMLSLEGAALQTRSVRMEEISTRALALSSCAGRWRLKALDTGAGVE